MKDTDKDKLMEFVRGIYPEHARVLFYDTVDKRRVDLDIAYDDDLGVFIAGDDGETYELSELELIDERVLGGLTRVRLLALAQSYCGMLPRDRGCKSWSEMQRKMADEIELLLGTTHARN